MTSAIQHSSIRNDREPVASTPPARKALPPIMMSGIDVDRLDRLVTAAAEKHPDTAEFLSREISRATIVPSTIVPPGLVTMGAKVEFRDDTTGQSRAVTLVYPHEADVEAGKLSILTPVGAALIGLSVGQSIEWQTPTGGWRSLTVLRVRDIGA